MDSVTQIVLGAAVAEAVLGKKVGNKAALWGAIAGTIPDLDVFANPFLSELGKLTFHRSITHSALFCTLLAPLLGFAVYKLYEKKGLNNGASSKDWTKLMFWALITHPILDCFTSWGTQLLWPFSSVRIAFNNIFVVDPLYTLPFALCLLLALRLPRESITRAGWNKFGLVLSSLYMAFTFLNQTSASLAFRKTLQEKGASVVRKMSFPTPLNNILWYVVAEEPSGFDIGYYSVLGDMSDIKYRYIPKNHQLIRDFSDSEIVQSLDWFSHGMYSIEQKGDTLLWHDLRFGLMNMNNHEKEAPKYVSTYILKIEGKELKEIVPIQPEMNFSKEMWASFWYKIRTGKDF